MNFCQKRNLNVRYMKLLEAHDVSCGSCGLWVMILLVLWIAKTFPYQRERGKNPCRVILTGDVFSTKFGRKWLFWLRKFYGRFAMGQIWPSACFCTGQNMRMVLYFFYCKESIKRRIIFVMYEIQISVFKKKFYWNLATFVCLCIVYGCFYTTMTKFSSFEDSISCKAQNIDYLVLYRKSVQNISVL